MKVKVTDGLQVSHDGKTWRDGQIAEVPEALASKWIQWGWATEVQAPTPRRKTTK